MYAFLSARLGLSVAAPISGSRWLRSCGVTAAVMWPLPPAPPPLRPVPVLAPPPFVLDATAVGVLEGRPGAALNGLFTRCGTVCATGVWEGALSPYLRDADFLGYVQHLWLASEDNPGLLGEYQRCVFQAGYVALPSVHTDAVLPGLGVLSVWPG